MIFEFLSKLDDKYKDAIYSINNQDGIGFSFQVDLSEDEEFFCYSVSYIQFEDGEECYSIESDTDNKTIWTEGLEYLNVYLTALRSLNWNQD